MSTRIPSSLSGQRCFASAKLRTAPQWFGRSIAHYIYIDVDLLRSTTGFKGLLGIKPSICLRRGHLAHHACARWMGKCRKAPPAGTAPGAHTRAIWLGIRLAGPRPPALHPDLDDL
eukprot:15714632-Heterocapsa_arctica.AAC.1